MNKKNIIRSMVTDWPEDDVIELMHLIETVVIYALANDVRIHWVGFMKIWIQTSRPKHASGKFLYEDTEHQRIRYWKPCCEFDKNIIRAFEKAEFHDFEPDVEKKVARIIMDLPQEKQSCDWGMVKHLSEASGWSEKQIRDMLISLETTILCALAKGEQVHWSSFCRIWPKKSRPKHSSGKHPYGNVPRKIACQWKPDCKFTGGFANMFKNAKFNDADPESRRKAREKILDELKQMNEKTEEFTDEQEKFMQAGC